MPAYRILRPVLTYEDILEIRGKPGMRLTETPLGAPPGERNLFLSRSVAWKGDRTRMPLSVKAANEMAILISKAYRGVLGTVIDPKSGFTITRKGLEQRKWREKPDLVASYGEKKGAWKKPSY